MSKLSLKAKLLLLCATFTAFTVVVGVIGYVGLEKTAEPYSHVATKNLPKAVYLGNMQSAFKNVRVHLRTLGLSGLSHEQALVEVKEAEKSVAAYEEAEKKYKAIGLEDEEKVAYDAMAVEWNNFKAVGGMVFALQKENTEEARKKMITIFLNDCPKAADAYNAAVEKMIAFQEREASHYVPRALKAESTSIWASMLSILFGASCCMALGFFYATSLNRQIRGITERLSAGAGNVATSAQQIAGASSQLSSSTTEQAAALQETVASIDEVSAMVQKNADNAKQSQSSTGQCSDVAQKGKEAVEQMIHSMKEIDDSNSDIMQQIEESNRQIGEIVTVINDITNKTKVINDIVFQTKLLSFNASVEAARAGEHGKGFAVVAEEVGNLAQMSGNAAKEISQMLDASAGKVQDIVTNTKSKVEHLMSASKGKVENGAVTARRCGEALDEIVRNVDEVKHMVSEIAVASHEQSQGVTEIGKAMNQLDQVTQSNSAATQESASVAANLKQQSERLAMMVSELTLTVEGAGKSTPSTAPAAPSATVVSITRKSENRQAA